jgi:hypothetical protein
MKNTYIKPKNLKLIQNMIHNIPGEAIQGTKLEALFNLIQKKGETVTEGEKTVLNQKALEIQKGTFLMMIRTGSKSNFFPCSIKSYILTEENIQ